MSDTSGFLPIFLLSKTGGLQANAVGDLIPPYPPFGRCRSPRLGVTLAGAGRKRCAIGTR
jgi:hypothetical protein